LITKKSYNSTFLTNQIIYKDRNLSSSDLITNDCKPLRNLTS